MIYEKLTGIKGVFGTKVAYVTAKRQGEGQLYSLIVSDQDGFNEHTIMESTDPIMSPAWSPDSRQLAYVSFEGNQSSIFVQTLRTGNRFKVSSQAGYQWRTVVLAGWTQAGRYAGRRRRQSRYLMCWTSTRAAQRDSRRTGRSIRRVPGRRMVDISTSRRTAAAARRSTGCVPMAEHPSA